MSPEFLTDVAEAYSEAAPLPPDYRKEFLLRTYAKRPDIIQEVLSLLQHQNDADRFTPSIAVAATAEMLRDVDDVIGSTIGGRFVIRRCIGTGAQAEVYLADHVALNIPFALKRPKPELRDDPDYRLRFLHEARRAVLLKHDNVARVHDVINEGPDIFVVMEHVDGETLRTRMAKLGRPFTATEFLPIAMQCAAALAAAHDKRIVHLDMKPENIMLTRSGQVKICDFGIARRLSSDDPNDTTARSDANWTLAGTPAYMAPEVILSQHFDERADLFSLGTVFYEMLSGRNPFLASTMMATTAKIVSGDPAALSIPHSKVHRQLSQTINRLLAKEPADRYATANDLLRDLQAAHRSGQRFHDVMRDIRESFGESHRLLVAAAAVVLLLLAAPAAWKYRDKIFVPAAATNADAPSALIIAGVENATGDSFFDSTVRELLNLSLMQSPQINVVSDERIAAVLRRLKQPADTKLDFRIAQSIATQERLDRVLKVRVIQSGSGYQILCDVFHGITGRHTAAERETLNTKDALAASISALSARLRSDLGESRVSVEGNQTPFERATSSSAVALERFAQANELERKGKSEDARILLASAVEIDPEFALAYAHLANMQASANLSADALRSITRAYELRDRVTEREKHFIAGYYHQLRTEYEDAVDSYKTAVALYPRDAVAYRLLASAHASVYDTANALAAVNRGLVLEPDNVELRGFLVGFLADENKVDEAIREAEVNNRQFTGEPYPHWNEGLAWLTQGDTTRARQAFEQLRRGGPAFENASRFFLALTSVYEGDFSAAVAQMEQDIASRIGTPREWLIGTRRYSLARLFLLLGKRAEALQQIMLLEKAETMPSKLYQLRDAGRLYAEMNEPRLAEQVIGKIEILAKDYPGNFGRAAVLQIRGEIDSRLGRLAPAREQLEEASRLWDDPGMLWSLARYWQDHADYAKAAGFYGKLIERKSVTLSRDFPGLWVLANLELARCNKALGKNPDALQLYNRFLAQWGSTGQFPSLREVERERDSVLR